MIDWESVEKERQRLLYKSSFRSLIVLVLFVGLVYFTYVHYKGLWTGKPLLSVEKVESFTFGNIYLTFIVYLLYIFSPFFLLAVIREIADLNRYDIEWRNYYLREVILKFFDERLSKLTYRPDRYISYEDFVDSRLFLDYPGPSIYYGKNLVSGFYRRVRFSFSQVFAYYEEVYRDNNGNTYTRTVPIFEGVLFKATFPKYVDNELLVYEGDCSLKGFQKVRMDHVEFGKIFTVFSLDSLQAYYVLNHALMDRILELRKRIGLYMRMSFIGDTLYLAISGMGYFEIPPLEYPTDPKQLELYEKQIQEVLSFIDQLALDRRLWTVSSL